MSPEEEEDAALVAEIFDVMRQLGRRMVPPEELEIKRMAIEVIVETQTYLDQF